MMDRAQFMQALEKLLADISETERQDDLDFYNSYFDDAGAENEASVLRELGSPEKVAAIIKADLKGSAGGYEYGEYTNIRSMAMRMPELKREDRCLRNMEKSREQGSVFSERGIRRC